MSRCTTPCRWACSRASATCRPTRATLWANVSLRPALLDDVAPGPDNLTDELRPVDGRGCSADPPGSGSIVEGDGDSRRSQVTSRLPLALKSAPARSELAIADAS